MEYMWQVSINNIGGIYGATAALENGVNIVQASNFSGKSSFMNAIQTVMGTTGMFESQHPLTEGKESGTVELTSEERTHSISLERSTNNEVVRRGTPVLEDDADQMCARLFAFLGEDNPIRSRVREQEDLTELLQSPLDIENIDDQIATLKRKQESKQEDIQTAQRAEENIPPIKEAISTLEKELDELRQRRTEVENRVGNEITNNDSLSDDLANRRSEVSTLERRISRLQSKISETETQLEEKRVEKEALEIPEQPQTNTDVEAKQSRVDEIGLQIDLLEGLYRANQRVIEENELSLVTSIDRTIVEDGFDCWICGESTTTKTIQTRLEALQTKIETLQKERATLRNEIETIEEQEREYREKKRQASSIEEEIGDLSAKLDDLQRDLSQAEERKDGVEEQVKELEADLEQAETELSEELTDIKSEIKLKNQELETQQNRLQELEAEQEDIDELRTELNAIEEEIEVLKQRKENKQRELKTEFDEAMATALDYFAPGFDGARLDIKVNKENEIEAFDLIVARDGRETTINTLSEAERELVGIVVAIAGYRTFEVSDRVPIILLDGVSQLAADNLRLLCEYLSDDTEMLVTTAYPEINVIDGNRIDPSEWNTISEEDTVTF
jgi:chromosome segregation ATPase